MKNKKKNKIRNTIRNKLGMIEITAGIGSTGYLFYKSLASVYKNEYGWFNIVLGIIILLIVIKSVPFMKSNEGVWLFFISMIAVIPFNIKLVYIIVSLYMTEFLLITKVLCGVLMYLCIFSIEEIMLGIVSRLFWPKQGEMFFYAVRKMEEEEEELFEEFE